MPSSRAERAAAFLRDLNAGHGTETPRVDEEELTRIKRENAAQESVAGGLELAGPSISARELNAGLEAVDLGRTPTSEQVWGIEAIIIPNKRPAMPLAKGTYTATHPDWLHLNEEGVKELLTRKARSIGRVEVPGSVYPYGGTAFVVGRNLLMTNRHVAEIFATGLGTRKLDFISGITPGFNTAFAPDNDERSVLEVRRVVMIHPYWDMSLLEVENLPSDLEILTLDPADAANFDRKEVAVIGYPAYDYRNDAGAQRTVFDNRFGIKQLQPGLLRERGQTESFRKIVDAVTHDCSTLGGNSGSCVIHIASGNVLALHFGGEYLKRNYAVPACELALDGRVVEGGVTFDPSVRPDSSPTWTGYWTSADGSENPPAAAAAARPVVPAASDQASPSVAASISSGLVAEIVIPLHITFRLGDASAGGSKAGHVSEGVSVRGLVERLAEPQHDRTYEGRNGFDERFLGLHTPLPKPTKLEIVARTRTGGAKLDYQNFSVVMHARRKLALFTASNVSREAALRNPEPRGDTTRRGLSGLRPNDQERWFTDPRLDDGFQFPDSFYTLDDGSFDKGHIVRRDDVAWGITYAHLKRANGDTYHVTNCSPQIAKFNRSASGEDNWGDLENVVLKQAATERLSLFAGPILAPEDPRFLGNFGGGKRFAVQIPTRFWKVIVSRVANGLAAYGFVLEQDLSEEDTTEFVVPPNFRRFLQPLADIEAMTGIVFPRIVAEADQFDVRGTEVARQAAVGRRRQMS